MEERCSRCKVRIFPSDKIVKCNDCGAVYHSRCWINYTEKCVVCGEDNNNFSNEKIQAYKNAVDEKATQEAKTAENYTNTTVKYVNKNTDYTLHSEKTGMFSNVGEKLKSWAKTHFIISVVLAVITFIMTWIIDDGYFLVGLIAGLTEIFVAWAFALILYAFGELVQNSKESKDIQQKILDELKDKKE